MEDINVVLWNFLKERFEAGDKILNLNIVNYAKAEAEGAPPAERVTFNIQSEKEGEKNLELEMHRTFYPGTSLGRAR